MAVAERKLPYGGPLHLLWQQERKKKRKEKEKTKQNPEIRNGDLSSVSLEPLLVMRFLFVLFLFFETWSCSIVQAGLLLRTVLPQPPESLDYTCASSQLDEKRLLNSSLMQLKECRT